MSTITVFGASGYTGALVCDALSERGHSFVAAGRDPDRVRSRVGHLDGVAAVRQADAHDRTSLRALLADTAVLISTVGPFSRLGRPVLEEAVAAGAHYVDSTGELPFVRWAFDQQGPQARAAGVAAVPAAGHDFVPGDLLASLACGALEAPREVHVTYLVRARGRLPGYTTSGTRASVAEVLGEPGVAIVDGELVEERPAEQRRLAWFPKPVGPHHAASFPGAEPLTVPRHVEGLRTVRTYLAVPTVVAELTQALGTVASSSEAVRRGVAGLLRIADRDPSPQQRAKVRWACVAETRDDLGTVARAWANGSDIYASTAATLVVVAEALLDGPDVSGVLAPSEVVDPARALDTLAERVGLRWHVARPDG